MGADLPVVLAQCRYGPLFVLTTDRYIGTSLLRFGAWSDGEMELLLALLRPGDVVVEVGANVGSHTVPLAKHVGGTGRVIAFEPQRALFRVLRGSIGVNNLAGTVELHQEAVGEEMGALHVPVFDYAVVDNFGGFSNSLLEFTRSSAKVVAHDTIAMRTIDSLALPACTLIKADVEGMETAVVAGAFETIERCRPLLYLEAHRGKSRALLLSLDALGYRLWRHSPPILAGRAPEADEKAWRGVVSDNILAAPAARPIPAEVAGRCALTPISDPYRDMP